MREENASQRRVKRRTIVMKQLLNQVHMRQDHPTTAIPLQIAFVESFAMNITKKYTMLDMTSATKE